MIDATETYPCPYRKNERVQICYDPNDPKRHEVIKKDKWKILSKQLNHLGILLLLTGCGLFLFYARSVGESRP